MLCNLLWPRFILRQLSATKSFKSFSPSSSDCRSPLQICSAVCGFIHHAGMEKISGFAVGFSLTSTWAVGRVLSIFPKTEQREKYIPTSLHLLPVDSNKRSQASQILFSKDIAGTIYFSCMHCARYENDSMSLHTSQEPSKNTSYLKQQRCNFESKQTLS